MPDGDFAFYLTVDDVIGTAQPDPNDSLGGNRSGTTLHEFESTITAAMTEAFKFLDTTRIGDGADAHAGKWVLFMDGVSKLEAAPIKSFDSATGEFVLDWPLTKAGFGDTYRIFEVNNCFNDVQAASCAGGTTQYRCLAMLNSSGTTATDTKIYLIPLSKGDADIEFVCSQTATAPTDVEANDTDEPDLSNSPWQNNGRQFFSTSWGYDGSSNPPSLPNNVANNSSAFAWVKRTIQPTTRDNPDAAFLMVVGWKEAGTPYVAGAVIPYAVFGYVPALNVVQDRTTYVGGGAQVRATVTSSETGELIEGAEVFFEITSGPGQLEAASATTDENGIAEVPFTCSEDVADAGLTTTIKARV